MGASVDDRAEESSPLISLESGSITAEFWIQNDGVIRICDNDLRMAISYDPINKHLIVFDSAIEVIRSKRCDSTDK